MSTPLILKGITSLLSSAKGTLSLIILLATTLVTILGHMDPTFGVVISVIGSVFLGAHAYVNGQALSAGTESLQDVSKDVIDSVRNSIQK